MNYLPPTPTEPMLLDFLRTRYKFSNYATNKAITPYEISDDIHIQYGYRFYEAEIRNLLRKIGHEPQSLPKGVKGYYLTN